MADNTFRIYITDKSFIIKRDSLNSKALVINRFDPSKIDIIQANQIDQSLRSDRSVFCVLGIFRLINECYLVVVTESDIAANFSFNGQQNVIRKIRCTDFISFNTGRGHSPINGGNVKENNDQDDRPYVSVMNLLNSGHFYWTPPNSSFDITRTYQSQCINPKSDQPVWERVDKRFYWNKYLQKDFIAYRLYDWCFPIIQGFVVSDHLGHIQGKNVIYTLISRRSRFRAGTRFSTRGIDDDGNVANFCESEQILSIENYGTLAFLQIRGSVPVFWNQSSPQMSDLKIKMSNLSKIGKISKKKIVIARNTQATTPAFQLHLKEQTSKYGNIVIINLLSKLKSGECDLVNAYEEQVRILRSPNVFYNHFDLNEQTKGNRMEPLDSLINYIDNQSAGNNGNGGNNEKLVGYFFQNSNGQIVSKQNGILRTNCKDCLDRTNIVQSRISWILFEAHLRKLGLFSNRDYIGSYPRVSQALKTTWADNGDALSIQYAGSGSLKSTLTREGDYGIMGMLADGKKTMTRFYINNFKDPGRQDVLDLLLGLHKSMVNNPTQGGHDNAIRKQVQDRASEFSQKEFRNVFVGTYNVGGVHSSCFDLTEWLKPGTYPAPDFYVLGLQEVVELTAGQILATDSSIGKQWEDTIERALFRGSPNIKYIKLQSNQLVGIFLSIYVREDCIHYFREVQVQNIKCGMNGLAGNKGGIGVRLLFSDTSFTFVTAHFAAGQSNVEDRINDYREIDSQLSFGRQGQFKVTDSDYSFWLGDFNFRIDLPDDEIKRCVNQSNFPKLYDYDQLRKCMEAGRVFNGYREEVIAFAPTYKYDFNSVHYDTSPKQRSPAWTDRIVWSNKVNHDLRQLYYHRSELLASDHRPVCSYFQLEVTKIDKEKERLLRQQLYEQKSSQFITVSQSTGNIVHQQQNKDGANLISREFEKLAIKQSSSTPNFNTTTSTTTSISKSNIQYQITTPSNNNVNGNGIHQHQQHQQQHTTNHHQQELINVTTNIRKNSLNSNSNNNNTIGVNQTQPRKLSSGRPLPMIPQPVQIPPTASQPPPFPLIQTSSQDSSSSNSSNTTSSSGSNVVNLQKMTGSGGRVSSSPSSSFINNNNNNYNNNNNNMLGTTSSSSPSGAHSPIFDDQFDPRRGRSSPLPFNDNQPQPPPMELLVPIPNNTIQYQPPQQQQQQQQQQKQLPPPQQQYNNNIYSSQPPIHSSNINPNSSFNQYQPPQQPINHDLRLIDSWGVANNNNNNNNIYQREPPPLQPIPQHVYQQQQQQLPPPLQPNIYQQQQPQNFMLQQPLQPMISPPPLLYSNQKAVYNIPNVYNGYNNQQQQQQQQYYQQQQQQQQNQYGSILD